MSRTIDVTGLSPEEVQILESIAEILRTNPPVRYGPPPGESAEEWVTRWRTFTTRHGTFGVIADDSREGIYGDDGR